MPQLSVLMVAHNAGRFLKPAVDSILSQTFRDLELVLVDNASTDGSVTALRETLSDDRLRIVSADRNEGAFGGARRGLPLCRGAYIARMDGDDIAHPQRLALQVAHLEVDPHLDGVGTGYRLIDQHGADCPERTHPLHGGAASVRAHSLFDMPFIHASLCARRAVFEQVPYRAAFSVSGDFDFALRVVERFDVVNIQLPLYAWRRHARSTSVSRRLEQHCWQGAMRWLAVRRRRGAAEDVDAAVQMAQRAIVTAKSEDDVLRSFGAYFVERSEWPLAAHYLRQLVARTRRPRDLMHYLRAARHAFGSGTLARATGTIVLGAPARAMERSLTWHDEETG